MFGWMSNHPRILSKFLEILEKLCRKSLFTEILLDKNFLHWGSEILLLLFHLLFLIFPNHRQSFGEGVRTRTSKSLRLPSWSNLQFYSQVLLVFRQAIYMAYFVSVDILLWNRCLEKSFNHYLHIWCCSSLFPN